MKQLLILVMALSLFTACKDKKESTRRDDRNTTRDKDDYRNTDDRNSDDRDNRNNDKEKDSYSKDRDDDNKSNNSASGWSSKDVRDFVTNCISSAVDGGMQQQTADSYCNCMQIKMEKLYPDVKEAGQLTQADLETPSMKRLIQDCLTER